MTNKSTVTQPLLAFLGGCIFVSLIYLSLPSQTSNCFKDADQLLYSRPRHKVATSFGPRPVDPAFNLKINPDRRFIILVTAFRSGSTFLGNLFDSNPSMFYQFEPFHDMHIRNLRNWKSLIGARADHTESDLRMLYLQQMLHNCTVFRTPFPEKYNECGTPEEHLVRFNSTECVKELIKPRGVTQQEICRYRKYHVIKVIRLADLKDIIKIHQIKRADLQVIQLLRHPVALMMSRRTGGKFFMFDQRISLLAEPLKTGDLIIRRTKMALEAYNYCQNHIRAMEFVEQNPWLKERYMRVTHHEMSAHPLETAEKIYNFIGAELTDYLRDYIRNITGAESDGFKNAKKGALNVYRNSTKILSKWKSLVSASVKYWDVFSIEALCKKMFDPMNDEFSVDGIEEKKLKTINQGLDDYYDEFLWDKPTVEYEDR